MALAGVRFLRGVERALQARWTYGIVTEQTEIPVLRLLIWPKPIPLRRPQACADEALMDAVLGRLLTLDLVTDETGSARPWIVAITDDACALIDDFCAVMRSGQAEAEGLLLSFSGKLSGLTAMLSLSVV